MGISGGGAPHYHFATLRRKYLGECTQPILTHVETRIGTPLSATLRRSASPQAQIANFGRGHHDGGSGESAPDGHYNAQAVAPRCARREPNAKCCSNRPRGDLRRARVDDFRMSQHLAALRAVALPAARDGAGRLATSCLTTPARGTRSQIAIPRRATAAVSPLTVHRPRDGPGTVAGRGCSLDRCRAQECQARRLY